MKKILFITEYLNPPYDEGIKKTVYNLFLELDKKYELKVICRYGFDKKNIHVVQTNPLFYSKKVKSIIKDFEPDNIIYLPFQSSTFASYLRLKVFSFFSRNVSSIFIALQPKPLKSWQILLVKIIKPKFALTPSPALKQFWDTLNLNNQLVPLITDLSIFKPLANVNKKVELRKKYNLPLDAFIISHMGHLNEGRNLKTLIPLQNSDIQIVIAASSSTPEDAKGQLALKNELLDSGMIILDRYLENIEDIYHLSDIYIFPVVKKNSSIGMPLSILEARACATPVITTNYGSVKSYMNDDFGGIVYSEPHNFIEAIDDFKKLSHNNYNKTNVPLLNKLFYDAIYNKIEYD
ncbi:MAG: glycosyltransferase family 4 protein [Flavobacteriaceae bacterium]|nr:glycosyltransferase family 4 protein [Flavobacteriaceae bacterium]